MVIQTSKNQSEHILAIFHCRSTLDINQHFNRYSFRRCSQVSWLARDIDRICNPICWTIL